MQAALLAAALEPGDIDYINLHGTGTPSNDRSESQAVTSIFGPTTPCSSTKGATGHTLGAAGALEAVISALAIRNGLMPGGVHTTHVDPTLTAHYIRDNRRARIRRVLSNSFGFGGTNCSLIFGSRRMKVSAYVGGIGVLGPGLHNWPAGRGRAHRPAALRTRSHGAAHSGDVAAGRAAAHRAGREIGAGRRFGGHLAAPAPMPRRTGQRVLLFRERRPHLP